MSSANCASSSRHTLTMRTGRPSALVRPESWRFLRRLSMSEADQKLIRVYSPFREPRDWEEATDRENEGASLPISREWVVEGSAEERKEIAENVKANDKISFLVFTIFCFRYKMMPSPNISVTQTALSNNSHDGSLSLSRGSVTNRKSLTLPGNCHDLIVTMGKRLRNKSRFQAKICYKNVF